MKLLNTKTCEKKSPSPLPWCALDGKSKVFFLLFLYFYNVPSVPVQWKLSTRSLYTCGSVLTVVQGIVEACIRLTVQIYIRLAHIIRLNYSVE